MLRSSAALSARRSIYRGSDPEERQLNGQRRLRRTFNNNAILFVDGQVNDVAFTDVELVNNGLGYAYTKTVPHLPDGNNHFIIMRRAESMAIKTEEFNIVC